jgi:23S rRNA-/tRNA-specific pseudouridylate synthase
MKPKITLACAGAWFALAFLPSTVALAADPSAASTGATAGGNVVLVHASSATGRFLRVDIDDRPRNIHDPVHGKPAHTEWQVLAREGGRTRVRFMPHTGRSHQLRVHAAHPQGLDAPIMGDRLYGRTAPEDDERLLLHAERIAFVHPVTGASVLVEQPAPF